MSRVWPSYMHCALFWTAPHKKGPTKVPMLAAHGVIQMGQQLPFSHAHASTHPLSSLSNPGCVFTLYITTNHDLAYSKVIHLCSSKAYSSYKTFLLGDYTSHFSSTIPLLACTNVPLCKWNYHLIIQNLYINLCLLLRGSFVPSTHVSRELRQRPSLVPRLHPLQRGKGVWLEYDIPLDLVT